MKNKIIVILLFSVGLVSASTFRISNEELVKPSMRTGAAEQFLANLENDFFEAVISKTACENDLEKGGMFFDGDVRSRLWLLCYAGAKVNACSTESKKTPLHSAVAAQNENAVTTLLYWHANPNVKDRNGRTPYSIALAKGKGYESIADLLKQRGALTDFHTRKVVIQPSVSSPVSPK